ncbi:MAG: nuclear transport factor 2 family protein [Actinomycetota bacterium]
MRRLALLIALAALALAPAAAHAAKPPDTSALTDRRASGLALMTAYSDLLILKDQAKLGRVLDDAFLIQRTDGSWADKARYLAKLPDLRDYAFDQAQVRRAGRMLTFRATATSVLTVNGEAYAPSPAPILTVWRWTGERWLLVAQGNFNVPRS